MTLLSIFNIGFSIIIAATLFIAYAGFLKNINKSWLALSSGSLLLSGLACAQYVHYVFFTQGIAPMETTFYRFLILMMPSMFYFFSRSILFPEQAPKALDALHLLPIAAAFIAPRVVAIPLAFLIGMFYTLWIARIVHRLMSYRKRFNLVLVFYGFCTIIAITSLALGISVARTDSAYFYYFYCNGIGLGFAAVVATLVIFPTILDEINEVVQLSYSVTTLGNVDLKQSLQKLESLMNADKLYQNENLSLSALAEAMQLSSHQLSELINTQFDISFSQYIRQQRIEAAQQLLVNEPKSSVLSIGMEVGFKSQSNFYAAFKEIAGESPGSYRKNPKK